MAASGTAWLPRARHGCLRHDIAASGTTWLPQARHGCLRHGMAASGTTWLPQARHGCLRHDMAASGAAWLPQARHGCLRHDMVARFALRGCAQRGRRSIAYDHREGVALCASATNLDQPSATQLSLTQLSLASSDETRQAQPSQRRERAALCAQA